MPKRLRPLTGLDALFVYLEGAGTPMHVASLIVLEPPAGGAEDERTSPPARAVADFADAVADHLRARLSRVPHTRRVLVDAPLALGHPLWADAADVDYGAHVVRHTLRKPGSPALLNAFLARVHAEPLRRDRPLWEAVVIDGLADGTVGVYMKSHHAMVDGQAGVRLAGALFEPAPTPPEAFHPGEAAAALPPPPRDAVARAALRAVATQFGKLIRGVPAGVKQVRAGARRGGTAKLRDSVMLAPRTPFNLHVGPQRRLALTSLPMAELKRIAKACGVSFNDVVMAVCAGALRTTLQRRRKLPAKGLVAAMPVSLREPGDESGNQVSMAQCPLPTDVADPLERLQVITAATQRVKQQVTAFRGLIPTDFPGLAAPLWAAGLSRIWKRGRLSERLPPLANLVISNVPGPPVPLYMAGARMRHYFPISIITHGLGLNITVLSYAGALEVGIVAAPETLDKPQALADAMRRALAELSRRCPA